MIWREPRGWVVIAVPSVMPTSHSDLTGGARLVYASVSYHLRALMEQEALTPVERQIAEEELTILQEIQARREGDPLLGFELHAKQKRFVEAVRTREFGENWFLAANRAGKSDAGAYIGAEKARFGDQGPDVKYSYHEGGDLAIRDRSTSGWVVSLDFPSSRDIIQPKYFDNGFMPPSSTHEPFIPEREIARNGWRVADQILKLKNGSIIGFKSADSGPKKFQGAEKNWIHFDEEPPQAIYEESIIRVGQTPLDVFGTCTLLPPQGQIGGVTWVYTEKVKPWQAGKAPTIGIFTASIYDNPHIDPGEIARLESIYPEGSLQRRIRLNGELLPGLSGARIYSSFSHQLNVREQPEITMRRPLCWIWDFNVEPMVSLVGQYDGKLFRVFHELILEEGNIDEMCDMFTAYHPSHMAEIWVYGDASGNSRTHQTNKSSYNLILNNMQGYPAPLRLKVPDKNPSVGDRINSVNRNMRDEKGVIRTEVDPSCQELIDDFEGVLSDGRGGIRKTTNAKDPYFKRTHTSDAHGYWIHFESPIKPITPQSTTSGIRIKRPGYSRRHD